MTHRVSFRKTALVFSLLLGIVTLFFPTHDSQAADIKRLILKFKVTGSITDAGIVTDPDHPLLAQGVWFEAEFVGPMTATRADPATGHISTTDGSPLGTFGPARVRFVFDLSDGLISSDTARFACLGCEIKFNDGALIKSVLKLNDPAAQAALGIPTAETDIPLEGRFLLEVGPVIGGNLLSLNLRGAGCGGLQEVAGKGALANAKGAICMNGIFNIPAGIAGPVPKTLPELTQFFKGLIDRLPLQGGGESDCTITAHVPVIPVP